MNSGLLYFDTKYPGFFGAEPLSIALISQDDERRKATDSGCRRVVACALLSPRRLLRLPSGLK